MVSDEVCADTTFGRLDGVVRAPRDRVGYIPRGGATPTHVAQYGGVISGRPPRERGGGRGGGGRSVAVWVVHFEQLQGHRKESRSAVTCPFYTIYLFQRDTYRDTKIACKRQGDAQGKERGIKAGRLLCPVVDE